MIARRSFLGGMLATVSSAVGSAVAGLATPLHHALGGKVKPPEGLSEGVEPRLITWIRIHGVGLFHLWEYQKEGHPFLLKEPPKAAGHQLVSRYVGIVDQSVMPDGFTTKFRRLCVTWERMSCDDPALTEIIQIKPAYVPVRYNPVARTVEMVDGVLLADYDAAGDVVGIELLGPVKVEDFMRMLILPPGSLLSFFGD